MSGAFEYAWVVLKALPEQQAFTESYLYDDDEGNPQRFQAMMTPQFTGYEGENIAQERHGTVPPPILGAMRRLQAHPAVMAERKKWMGENPPLDMNVRPERADWMRTGIRPKNFGPWMTHGRLSHVPK